MALSDNYEDPADNGRAFRLPRKLSTIKVHIDDDHRELFETYMLGFPQYVKQRGRGQGVVLVWEPEP